MAEDKNNAQEPIKLLAPIVDQIPEDTRGKVDFFIEIALIFVLGILIGIAVKTEAAKRITIGYNDYQIKTNGQQYNINKLQDDLLSKKSSEAGNQASQPAVPSGGSCGQ